MIIESIFGSSCTACCACMNACPSKAITLEEDIYGFYQPTINHNKCINCGVCDKTCPILQKEDSKTNYSAYCGYIENSQIRDNSSSGGIFRAIADVIINKGGIVYGAAFRYGANLRLEHCSSKEVGIEALQKSKYVQSYVGYIYQEIKRQITDKRPVLFVGTPCQVDGLLSYLGGDDPNLTTCDFICHGVPSMHFFKDHLHHIGFNNLQNITNIDFRPKIVSWVDYLIVKSKHKSYKNYYLFDSYFSGFNKTYITLRKSCYQCHYCNGLNRKADITLADFWGITKTDIKIDYHKGLSLILTYTPKGENVIKNLSNTKLQSVKIDDTEYVYRRKRSVYYPHKAREKFFEDYKKYGYQYAVSHNGMIVPKKERILFNLKQFIKKKIQ